MADARIMHGLLERPPEADAVVAASPEEPVAPALAPPPDREPSGWRLALDGSRVLLVAAALYTVFFNLSIVRGSSMAPGILDGDRILVEPWSYVIDEVERGDVVVLRYPLDPRIDYIKRIVGVPGDHVFLADGNVWVNGELVREPYVAEVDRATWHESTVGRGEYFVLGDNRPRSSDSRDFGLVPESYIRGRVDLRLWPLSRVGWID
jgi:signal peptidase I